MQQCFMHLFLLLLLFCRGFELIRVLVSFEVVLPVLPVEGSSTKVVVVVVVVVLWDSRS